MKFIFSDVDQTLVSNGGPMSKELIESFRQCQAAGVEVVLSSGRPTKSLIDMSKQLQALDITFKYVSGYNGGQIYDLTTQTVAYENGFNQEEVTAITDHLLKIGMSYAIYDGNDVLTDDETNQYALHESTLNDMGLIETSRQTASIKVLGLVEPEVADEKLDLIVEKFPQYTVAKSTPFFIEITKPGVDKGQAIVELSKMLDFELTDVVVFGDGNNDLSMFKLDVKGKYAVDNGTDLLKSHATEVVASCIDNGVSKQINKLLLANE